MLGFVSAAALAAAALVSVAPRVGASTEVDDAGDVPATAQVIATAETQIDGFLGANDIDLYQLCVDGGAFSAEVTSYGGSDSVLYLFGGNGYYVHFNDDDGAGNLSLLELADLPAGTYYLGIGDYWSEPNNSPWEAPTETLTSWPDTGSGTETGAYTITLDGLSAAPCTVPPVNTTDLYAVGYATGGPREGAPSNLYTVDPNTGAATLIGPIEVDGTQLIGITGIDFGLDGLLYAVDNANERLLTLDTTTGAATVVGSYGSASGWMPDIAFDAYGYLYGWDEGSDDLARIYADGSTGWIGPSGIGTAGTGLVVDAANDMYVKNGWNGALLQVSPQTGLPVGAQIATFGYLDGYTSNPADFDSDDALYTVVRPEAMSYVGVGSVLETLDPTTGLLMAVGHEPDVMITGLAFDTGTTTPLGDSTQLDVTEAPAPTTVTIGGSVDLTVTVGNHGPLAALVTVTVPLPAGLTYATHSGGTYDSSSGVWSVGTLGVGDEASLTVTATATAVGWPTITAVASADVYVPGPAADFAVVTVLATTPGTPADVAVSAGDGRAQLSWTAPYDGGAGITGYRIYTCTGAACTAGTGTYTTATASPATLTGLTNGTVYGFAVRAVNSAGVGTASATVHTTPQFASATITSAIKGKGKVTITFSPTVPPLEVTLGTSLTYQVSGPKAGTWLSCTPVPSTTTCVVKTSAKTVAIRVSTTNGTTWGPASPTVTVTR